MHEIQEALGELWNAVERLRAVRDGEQLNGFLAGLAPETEFAVIKLQAGIKTLLPEPSGKVQTALEVAERIEKTAFDMWAKRDATLLPGVLTRWADEITLSLRSIYRLLNINSPTV
ncbi:MAG: hypothetical protein B7W98_02490 [Parcubacteria group bacterium 20-58-5]|nr:MAG: hypothetical protein B7W98_02490 [Parcubacteria group bacterium 20-58-5]OYV63597.1 MAG: hypothetical protein B7X03_01100 [Parcubacteria group bacterium 21-58-10]